MRGSVHEAAERFGSVSDEYERARPDYSAAVVERLVSELDIRPGRSVLDLGAGTGKLTRLLPETGASVVGLEPITEMRARFVEVLPAVPLVAGLAEALPFAGESFDAVVCAQAFHWFDGPRALAEIHRVLSPGGRLALLWNVKDEEVGWVEQLGDILRPYQNRVPQETTGEWRKAFDENDLFGPMQEARFPHSQVLDAPGLVERYASASYVAMLPEAERDSVLKRIGELAESHPDIAGGPFDLPYVTELHWYERR